MLHGKVAVFTQFDFLLLLLQLSFDGLLVVLEVCDFCSGPAPHVEDVSNTVGVVGRALFYRIVQCDVVDLGAGIVEIRSCGDDVLVPCSISKRFHLIAEMLEWGGLCVDGAFVMRLDAEVWTESGSSIVKRH